MRPFSVHKLLGSRPPRPLPLSQPTAHNKGPEGVLAEWCRYAKGLTPRAHATNPTESQPNQGHGGCEETGIWGSAVHKCRGRASATRERTMACAHTEGGGPEEHGTVAWQRPGHCDAALAEEQGLEVSMAGTGLCLGGGGGQGGFLVRSLGDVAGSYSVAHRAGLLPTELTGV